MIFNIFKDVLHYFYVIFSLTSVVQQMFKAHRMSLQFTILIKIFKILFVFIYSVTVDENKLKNRCKFVLKHSVLIVKMFLTPQDLTANYSLNVKYLMWTVNPRNKHVEQQNNRVISTSLLIAFNLPLFQRHRFSFRNVMDCTLSQVFTKYQLIQSWVELRFV